MIPTVRCCLISLVFILTSACKNSEQRANLPKVQKRPNIIWLVAEDQSPEWFPMYGDTTITLPVLESLAQDGVVYTNAVTPAPVCAPARSAIITGMYPTTLGTHNMRTYTPWREVNEPLLDSLPSYSPMVPEGVKMFTEYLRKTGYYTANGPKEDYNFEKTDAAWDESSNQRHWRKRKPGQPFFTVFNFSVCHESQIWARGKDSLFVDPAKVPVPSYFPDTQTVRHDLAVNYSNLKRLDDQIGEVISQLKADGLYDEAIIFFYSDHGGPFPRHKRALYDTGLKVPMVVKLPDNHRAGERNDTLFSFVDLAPTVLSLAGLQPPKVMQGRALMGAYKSPQKARYTFHASDRFDEVYDRLRAVRSPRYKYIRSFDTLLSHALPVSYREQMPMMQELRKMKKTGALNEEQRRWLEDGKPTEELYDLVQDPYELNNLAQDDTLRDTLMHYRKVLDEWIRESNDLGAVPERELIQRWLPNGVQPKLPPLVLEPVGTTIKLHSDIRDATIAWKRPQDSIWNIYSHALPDTLNVQAKAERIGLADSEVLLYDP
ncbi:sulfatase [Maribacter chungangensis]|uniref:Sulfatase n=1 Tax=Maribacter chungangensis TaxID=1069117 RepID=A0ABW3B3E2_9FLAO